ncbi:hypothetical protein ES319_D04G005600v1 [Gossypium barbadense]|uniref:Uncharacterized protein n=1 Tax=Gossypium barbadense TaxID=3634 RepID=A0A5J5RQ49_GOSBA|nr:hypothetical protein ES319_D04G005600v1 [Gossypium barbadense]
MLNVTVLISVLILQVPVLESRFQNALQMSDFLASRNLITCHLQLLLRVAYDLVMIIWVTMVITSL